MRIVAVLIGLVSVGLAQDSRAMHRRGLELAKTDPAAAEHWLRRAIAYGDRTAHLSLAAFPEKPGAPEAVAKGRAQLEAGDALGAIVTWRHAMTELLSRDAALALGDLFAKAPYRSYNEALDAYRVAIYGGRLRDAYLAASRHRKTHPMLAAAVLGASLLRARKQRGVLPAEKSVFAAWELAARTDLDALTTLGMYHYLAKQRDRALLILWQAADRGHVDAAYYLVTAFNSIDDTEAAQHWMNVAAERGQAEATVMAAFTAGRTDRTKSVPLFRQAAAAGSALARTWVGVAYMRGKDWGVETDLARAEREFRLAAQQREPLAMRLLGVMLARAGKETEGWQWLARSAVLGNKEALDNIKLRAKEKRPIALFHFGRLQLFGGNVAGGLTQIKAAAAAGCEPAVEWLKQWGP